MSIPPSVWLLVFFLVPLALVWAMSFGEKDGLIDIAYGVMMARKAMFAPEDVVNTRSVEGFLEFCANRKPGKSP